MSRLRPLVFLAGTALAAGCASSDSRAAGDPPVSSAGAGGAAGARADAPAPSAADFKKAMDHIHHVDTVIRFAIPRTKKDTMSLMLTQRAAVRRDSIWPVKMDLPLPGSILPYKRIVAFYGNPLSKKMGILGELPPDQMLAKLDKEVAAWTKADPVLPVQPALHLIAVVAQGDPGRDGKYRLRMTDSLIERTYRLAKSRNAILFLDIQVGLSTIRDELPRLLPFLERPDVHLGIDPEFSMKDGTKPGRKIGTYDAADVNYVVRTLADLVERKKLPPKVLIVHRFTRKMVTNARSIRPDPRVQVVMDMDGWGAPWLKYDSYRDYIQAEPVQFTGFKLFYKNDQKKGDPMLRPPELLTLMPKPVYVQYQ